MICLNRLPISPVSAAVIALLILSGEADAVNFTFTKIVDTNTAFPNDPGKFSLFTSAAIDNGIVAFQGTSSTVPMNLSRSPEGIFIYDKGLLTVVADTINTRVPGTGGRFDLVSSPSINQGNVAFGGSSAEQPGLYTYAGGSLNVVANTTTQIPGKTTNFAYLGGLSLNNGSIAFQGASSDHEGGIYIRSGSSINFVANRQTLIPNTNETFLNFNNPSFDGNTIAFSGSSSDYEQAGVYNISLNGSLQVIADKNTLVPGRNKNFTSFGEAVISEGNVLFGGYGGYLELPNLVLPGLYTTIGNSLNKVADLSTNVPEGTGNFSQFDYSYSIDGQNVAFVGYDTNKRIGLYTTLGGTLTKVIDASQSLDNKTIRFLEVGREGLSKDSIAFQVFFADNSLGIYRADAIVSPQLVPEPRAILGILGFGAFGIGSRLLGKLKSQKPNNSNT